MRCPHICLLNIGSTSRPIPLLGRPGLFASVCRFSGELEKIPRSMTKDTCIDGWTAGGQIYGSRRRAQKLFSFFLARASASYSREGEQVWTSWWNDGPGDRTVPNALLVSNSQPLAQDSARRGFSGKRTLGLKENS